MRTDDSPSLSTSTVPFYECFIIPLFFSLGIVLDLMMRKSEKKYQHDTISWKLPNSWIRRRIEAIKYQSKHQYAQATKLRVSWIKEKGRNASNPGNAYANFTPNNVLSCFPVLWRTRTPFRNSVVLYTVFDDPRVSLDLVKRDSLFGIKYEKLEYVSWQVCHESRILGITHSLDQILRLRAHEGRNIHIRSCNPPLCHNWGILKRCLPDKKFIC